MSTKQMYLIAILLGLSSVAPAATLHWTAGGTDRLWSNPDNWEGKKVPAGVDEAYIDVPPAAAPNGPIIQAGIEAKALGLACEVAGEATMTMTGGTLEIADWIWWGDGASCHGIFTMSGGAITVVNEHELGWGGGSGTWIMTGGAVTAGKLVIPTATGAAGRLYLRGGTYTVGTGGLSMTPTGLIDIEEGTLLLTGNRTGEVQGFISGGRITAYGGQGYLEMDYDQTNAGMTTVIAVPVGDKANRPDPADGANAVTFPLLKWSPGRSAALHEVYLGLSPDNLEPMGRQPLALYYHVAGLQPGTVYYWRVDEVEQDGVTVHTGDVWHFMTQALTAYYPSPADKGNDAAMAPTLSWMPGMGAGQHHLYFGDSLEAVTQGTAGADKGMLTETVFAPGVLESLTTYYWRVDETVAGGAVKVGPVWSFTTTLPVDDFESYTDDLTAKTTIFDTWIDGLANGLSGSTVGYANAPFAEQKIVHAGKQSMPMDYNNARTPFYSEAEREFAPVQDWTTGGADTLILHVRGKAANSQARLYVKLEDASKHTATVVHPDAALVTIAQWSQWKIPLSSFAGVDPARVKKLCIGVGDRANPQAGGKGRLYLDDIGLAKP
jgi:hypothetical protein